MITYQIKNGSRICVLLTPIQKKELEYLARWTADLAYIKERFGANDPEAQVSRGSIELAYEILDRLHVPFWLQNEAAYFAEDWRRYKSMSLLDWLCSRYQVQKMLA